MTHRGKSYWFINSMVVEDSTHPQIILARGREKGINAGLVGFGQSGINRLNRHSRLIDRDHRQRHGM